MAVLWANDAWSRRRGVPGVIDERVLEQPQPAVAAEVVDVLVVVPEDRTDALAEEGVEGRGRRAGRAADVRRDVARRRDRRRVGRRRSRRRDDGLGRRHRAAAAVGGRSRRQGGRRRCGERRGRHGERHRDRRRGRWRTGPGRRGRRHRRGTRRRRSGWFVAVRIRSGLRHRRIATTATVGRARRAPTWARRCDRRRRRRHARADQGDGPGAQPPAHRRTHARPAR